MSTSTIFELFIRTLDSNQIPIENLPRTKNNSETSTFSFSCYCFENVFKKRNRFPVFGSMAFLGVLFVFQIDYCFSIFVGYWTEWMFSVFLLVF